MRRREGKGHRASWNKGGYRVTSGPTGPSANAGLIRYNGAKLNREGNE